MKKIIRGKKYDTDTATAIGWNDNNLSPRDFGYCYEELYRKRTGEYFLYGKGGPASKYRERCGNAWSGGTDIIPLTYDEARQWAEDNLDADDYEDIFGEVVEDDSRICVSLSLSAAGVERARREASARGVSLSALVDEYFATL